MNQAAYDELWSRAKTALKAGRKREAQQLLQQAARQRPDDHRAWLWLAALTPATEARIAYITKAETLRPDDRAVQKAKIWAEGQLARSAPAAAPPKPKRERPAQPPDHEAHYPVTDSPSPAHKQGLLFGGVALAALLILALLCVGLLRLAGPDLHPGAALAGIIEASLNGGNDLEPALELKETAAPPTLVAEVEPEPAQEATATATPLPIQPKEVVASAGQIGGQSVFATWTPTPTPTNTPTPSPTPTATPTHVPTAVADISHRGGITMRPAGVGPNERWIAVNLTAQTLTAYEGDTPVRQTLISSGRANTPTVTGTFRIYLRYERQDMNGYRLGFNYYLRDVPYVQYFYRDYGLHGTFWHSNFGTPMSHGCVNLPTPEAQWLFHWARIGTVVYVHY